MDKAPILKKRVVNSLLREKGSYIPSWVKWDNKHPEYQLPKAQRDADHDHYSAIIDALRAEIDELKAKMPDREAVIIKIQGWINGSQSGIKRCDECQYWGDCKWLAEGHWCSGKTQAAVEKIADSILNS